jgi:hypothetical protein
VHINHFPDGTPQTDKPVFTNHKICTNISNEQSIKIIHKLQAVGMFAFQFMLCTYVVITNDDGRNASNEYY